MFSAVGGWPAASRGFAVGPAAWIGSCRSRARGRLLSEVWRAPALDRPDRTGHVIQRILRHLGVPTEIPELRPARAPPIPLDACS